MNIFYDCIKKRFFTDSFAIVSFILCSLPFFCIAQQQIGYYQNMDGGFENQASGSLSSTLSTTDWSYVSSGNGQSRTITTSGGYGGGSYLTVGKTSSATSNSSTTINSNQVSTTTFATSTKYIVQFHYRANAANAATPDPTSFIFISADGTSSNRITTNISLSTPNSWTLFTGTVTTNSTTQTTSGTAGINIKTSNIGTATLIDVDNFVIYPADNQTNPVADVTPPGSVTNVSCSLNAPTKVSLSWTAPSGGIDNGGYMVVRYSANPGGTDNPLQNAIYAVGDTLVNANNGVVVYTGKTASCIDNLSVNVNTTYYYRIYTADKAFNYSTAVLTTFTTTHTPVNYYIDANSGNDANNGTTTSSAWKTIAKINSTTFYAGDSILLKCGCVWTGTTLNPLGSGQSGKPIVVSSYSSGTLPEIDADGSGLHNLAAAYLYNQQYFTVSNLILTNNYAATQADTVVRYGMYVLATDAGTITGITIKNLIVHDVYGSYNSTNQSGGIFANITGSGIVTLFDSLTITGCKVYNVDYTGISNQSNWADRSINADYGSTPWRPSTNLIVSNNIVDTTGGNGIIVRVAQSPVIQNNILRKCAKTYSGNALFVFNCNDALIQYNEVAYTVYNANDADASAFDGDYRCRRTVFQYNYSHDNDGGFAVVVCDTLGTPQRFNDSCVFRYNISQNDGHFNGNKFNLGEVVRFSGQTTNTFFYNNTIYTSTDYNFLIIHRRWGNSGSIYPDVNNYYNNIFYVNKATTSISLQSSTNNFFSNNNFYEPLGGTYPTDANLITANPLFVNAGSGSSGIASVSGYKLANNSPCINAGVTVTNAPSADYWGNTVPNGTTDIGANEFGSNWTGAVSNAWGNAANWYDNTVPVSTSNVLLSAGKTNYPTINAAASLNNLIISAGASLNITDTLKVYGSISNSGTLTSTNGTIGFYGSSPQIIPANAFSTNTIQHLIINNTSGVSLSGTLNITGTLSPLAGTFNSGGYLTLISNASGTARIDQVSGSISGNVTVQRYIPPKTTRKYTYLGSCIAQTIRNAWQQQIYITGSGTGGMLCGSTTGDGGSTDKYNSNGFDVSPTNYASMFTYNAAKVNGSHYVSIANTDYTSLTPGKGYCVNIRGNRNSGGVSCANQLGSGAPTPPEAVTLVATGTVTTGDVSIALNNPAISSFTLVANPYPSQISFSAFKTSNSNIYNNLWTYSPFGNGNYTTYSNGTLANGASGYDNTSGNYIASGQAFFVQANASGNVTFHENHKTNGTIPNTQYFGNANSKLIRIELREKTGSNRLDEIVIKLNDKGTKQYDPSWDAVSLNSGSQVLVSLKGDKRLAIATYPENNLEDTIHLGIVSATTGNFQMDFSEFNGIDSSKTIILRDNYLSINHDLRNNHLYSFNTTSDSNSVGNKRFEIIIGKGNIPLSIGSVNINAAQTSKGVTVNWQVVDEKEIASYILERSNDATTYKAISTINANGANRYEFTDYTTKPSSKKKGGLYYRLRIVDKAGNTSFSKIVSAILTTFDAPFTTFPNPASDKLTISGSHIASLKVIDNLGREVKVITLKDATNPSLTVNNLLAGTYYLHIQTTDGNNSHISFIKE